MYEKLNTKLKLKEKQNACNKETPHDKNRGRVLTTKHASTKKASNETSNHATPKTIPDASNQSDEAHQHKTWKTNSKIPNPKLKNTPLNACYDKPKDLQLQCSQNAKLATNKSPVYTCAVMQHRPMRATMKSEPKQITRATTQAFSTINGAYFQNEITKPNGSLFSFPCHTGTPARSERPPARPEKYTEMFRNDMSEKNVRC